MQAARCPSCGRAWVPGESQCPFCGAVLYAPEPSVQPQATVFHLQWVGYDGVPRSKPVGPSGVRIGRDLGSDIVLQDPLVSRYHAAVWTDGAQCYVRDEGSSNGTFVNDRQISAPTPLQPGDRIRLGQTTFTIVGVPEAPPEPKPESYPAAPERRVAPAGKVASLVGQAMVFLGGIAMLVAFFLPWLSVSVLGLPDESSGMEMLSSALTGGGWYQRLADFLQSVDPNYVLPPLGIPLQVLVAILVGAVWMLLSLAIGYLLDWNRRFGLPLTRFLVAGLSLGVFLWFSFSLTNFWNHPATLQAFQDVRVNGSISLRYGYWGAFSGACLALVGSLWECILAWGNSTGG